MNKMYTTTKNTNPSGAELSTLSPGFSNAPNAADPFWQQIKVDLRFSIIGAPKSGTTWLYYMLRQHPNISLPDELNFYTLFQARGAEYYNSQFDLQAGHVCGDYSNSYMLDRNLPEAFAQKFPGIKLILVGRNPVERAFSHYLMDINQGVIGKNVAFEETLSQPRYLSYYDHGLYGKHLSRFLEYVPISHTRFFTFEEMIDQPTRVVREVFQFLHIDEDVNLAIPPKANSWLDARLKKMRFMIPAKDWLKIRMQADTFDYLKGVYPKILNRLETSVMRKPKMKKATRQRLIEAYADDVSLLERIYQKDLSSWVDFS